MAKAATSEMIVRMRKSASFSKLERVEEVAVHVAPVAHPRRVAELAAHGPPHLAGGEGIVQLDLDAGDAGSPAKSRAAWSER